MRGPRSWCEHPEWGHRPRVLDAPLRSGVTSFYTDSSRSADRPSPRADLDGRRLPGQVMIESCEGCRHSGSTPPARAGIVCGIMWSLYVNGKRLAIAGTMPSRPWSSSSASGAGFAAPRSAVPRAIAAPARSWSASPRAGTIRYRTVGLVHSAALSARRHARRHDRGPDATGRLEPDPAGDGRASRLAVRVLHAGFRRRPGRACSSPTTGTDDDALRTGLAGNLCRCTGYVPILEAGLSVDPANSTGDCRASIRRARCSRSWPRMRGSRSGSRPGRAVFFRPSRLEDAVAFQGAASRRGHRLPARPSWASSGTSRGSSRRPS